MEAQKCKHCDKVLAGRLDKKFCDTQCRSSYHNRHKRKSERIISAVNQQLRKNRSILKDLCPEGKSTVRKELLLDRGFAFQYFTSIYKTNSVTYYFSYEYGYAAIEQKSTSTGAMVQKVMIIQHQDYMKGSFDPWSAIPINS